MRRRVLHLARPVVSRMMLPVTSILSPSPFISTGYSAPRRLFTFQCCLLREQNSSAQIQDTQQQQQQQQQQQEHSEISIEDFLKVRIVVGKVVSVEDLPKSNKLLKLTVDVGEQWGGKRTILSGIKQWFGPSSDGEDLTGKKVLVVENLKPRKMFGMQSHGMLLMAYHEDNTSEVSHMSTVGPHLDDIPVGTVVT